MFEIKQHPTLTLKSIFWHLRLDYNIKTSVTSWSSHNLLLFVRVQIPTGQNVFEFDFIIFTFNQQIHKCCSIFNFLIICPFGHCIVCSSRPEYSWKIARWTLNANQSINHVLLRFTSSGYPFYIFKLFLMVANVVIYQLSEMYCNENRR